MDKITLVFIVVGLLQNDVIGILLSHGVISHADASRSCRVGGQSLWSTVMEGHIHSKWLTSQRGERSSLGMGNDGYCSSCNK